MILDTTHNNKEHKQLLIDLVGKTIGFFEAYKMRGISSKPITINEVSPSLHSYINQISDSNFANIELRSKGIIIYINKGLKNITWAIPYYQLVILYKTNGVSIHAQGKFIHFKNNKTFKENKSFFNKMLDEKIKYDQQHKLKLP
ncbi:hypothetical protein [Gelatiniphilus marinus]|uniref:Arginyl-tRNA synthetase n=1 Tax=Gelatiniphilus marinus TaxID=1759464 RepID=A0ABW5JQ17_9FLAO